MTTSATRRTILAAIGGAAVPSFSIHVRAAEPVWRARQFHNQPAQSHQHKFLVDLWDAVRSQTGGRFDVSVYAQNGNVPGSDPQALEMLVRGELEFFTLMGGILGKVVPAAEIQGLPFAFTSHEQVHRANDGALGEYLTRECAAKGIHRFPRGLMENGFRHIGMVDRPIRTADDLSGVRMRVPDGQMFRELFKELGAVPVTVNIKELYDGLKERRVDGQENPLVVTEFNKLYEVTRYMSLTSHMWSGFNLLANLEFWKNIPADIQDVVDRNVATFVARQRAYTDKLNGDLQSSLAARGMIFNTADTASFRQVLGVNFYNRWKAEFGSTAWQTLEDQVGKLG
jgi:tripartite ATP-independent transporter DctP family solute receptor